MKKVVLMLALLVVVAQGVSKGNSPVEKNLPQAQATAQRLSQVAVAQETPDPWGQMAPAVDAIALVMADYAMEYDLESPEFVWTSLYYMMSINQVSDFRVTELEEIYLVPGEMVEDCAYALFGQSELPPLPVSLSAFVRAEGADYVLAKGNRPLVETALLEMEQGEDGDYVLWAAMLSLPDDMAEICRFQVTLTPAVGMFGYTITEMELFYPVG